MTLVALALLKTQAADQVVVTTAPPLDAQRLADALRVYLDEFGIRVETRTTAEAGDLRTQLDDARRLGEAVRAVAVVRVERGAPGSIEIELIDLATDKVLLVAVPRPARDEDLYRALALKIQAVLRATLSEVKADLDPSSSLGRLVAQAGGATATSEPAPRPPARLGLDAGYAVLSFPIDGASFWGLAFRAWWLPVPRLELAVGTAALTSIAASSGGVDARVTDIPLRASARIRIARSRTELLIGPCAEVGFLAVETSSVATPVRSTRNVMISAGIEAEGRVAFLTSFWGFARAAAFGVFNGERYAVAGSPLVDTSRLQVSGAVGLGIGLP